MTTNANTTIRFDGKLAIVRNVNFLGSIEKLAFRKMRKDRIRVRRKSDNAMFFIEPNEWSASNKDRYIITSPDVKGTAVGRTHKDAFVAFCKKN
jgi:hypothetical protein